MSEAAINEDLTVIAAFTKSRALATGLTVTVDGYDQLGVKIISDAAATEIGTSGMYMYTLDDAYNDASGLYSFVFKTTDADVDITQVPAAVIVRGNNTSPAGSLPVTSSVSHTRATLLDFIKEYAGSENAKPNAALYDTLIAQALYEISERTKLYQVVLTNAADGALTITSNEVYIAPDYISIERAEWGDNDTEVKQKSEVQLDIDTPGWRTATGDPVYYAMVDTHTLLLSSIPSDATGKLTLYCRGYLPALSADTTVQNPLVYIPLGSQLMVAYYVIANLPVPACKPINDSREAIAMAQWETQRRIDSRAEYRAKYEAQIDIVSASCSRKIRKPFTY